MDSLDLLEMSIFCRYTSDFHCWRNLKKLQTGKFLNKKLGEELKDFVDPNDPHISDLLVSHYDCSKQNKIRQFSLTRVNPVNKLLLL